jgi:hypothetical protein
VTATYCFLNRADIRCGNRTISLADLPYGQNVVQLTVDGSGGSNYYQYTFTVIPLPVTPPTVVLTSLMPSTSTQTTGVVTFVISHANGVSATVTCTLDGAPTTLCLRNTAAFSINGPGSHVLTITVSASNGNASAQEVFETTS